MSARNSLHVFLLGNCFDFQRGGDSRRCPRECSLELPLSTVDEPASNQPPADLSSVPGDFSAWSTISGGYIETLASTCD